MASWTGISIAAGAWTTVVPGAVVVYLSLEDGDLLLLEDGGKLVIGAYNASPWTPIAVYEATWT